ncbi:hypothetical protein ACN38_g6107 [Penicillium nordicum]|uniref:Uncharacterized protein n=1 Tax=Penicillium nordicum TaxID=229535 RepID=A0A0M9WFK4_9EURO|nr:hypothetical protein ACN38_g6107 [Penicillium nordicum]
MKSSVFQSWTKKAQWIGSVGLKGLIWRRGVGIVKSGGKENPGILAWSGDMRLGLERERGCVCVCVCVCVCLCMWTMGFEFLVYFALFYACLSRMNIRYHHKTIKWVTVGRLNSKEP